MRKILATVFTAIAFALATMPALAAVCAPTPALPDVERRTEYTGIVAQTGPFNTNFQLYGDGVDFANWIEVWVNGNRLVGTTDYTVTSPSGPLANLCRPISDAQVTFTAAQTGTIEILGARRPRRTSQFSENAGVQARSINQIVSDMEAQLRERWDFGNRVLRSPPGETLAVMPPAATRAGKFLKFDLTGLIPQAGTGAGSGNVVGPITSVVSDIPTFANTTGDVVADSGFSFKNGRPYADVRAWGAVGDGLTDDTAAFQAAAAYLSANFFWGGEIYVPPGNGGNSYCVKGGVTLGRGIKMRGANIASSVLSACGTDVNVVKLDGLASTIENLTIVGKGSDGGATFGSTQPTILVSVNSVACVINHVKAYGGYNALKHLGADCFFEDFQSNNYYGDAQVYIGGSVWMHRFVADDAGTGVNLPTAPFTVADWQATHAYTLGQVARLSCSPSCPPGVTQYYIQATVGGTSGGSAPTIKNRGVNIVDGTVTWLIFTPVGGAAIRIDTNAIEVRGDKIDMSGANDYGLAITNTLAGTAPSYIRLNTLVIGNALQNAIWARDGHDLIIGPAAELGGCMTANCSTVLFNTNWTGNSTISNSRFLLAGSGADYGVNIQSGNNYIVSDNMIDGPLQVGIVVAGAKNATVLGNVLINPNFGIQVTGAAANYSVMGNNCRTPTTICVTDSALGANRMVFGNDGGALAAVNGGTGQVSFTIGDMLYADTTTTLARFTDVALGRVLISGGVATPPSYSATPVLGQAGSTVGSLAFENATSGRITVSPPPGALGSVSLLWPSASSTIVGTANNLSVFAPTTSAQLAGVLSDETGTGAAVFANSPTLVTPALGTPASGVLTNTTGLPLTTGVTGTLPVANGGTNCAGPSGTCLDNITGFNVNGSVTRTGAGVYAARTITGTANQITVTNGDGVSGNPTLSLTNGSPVAKVKVQKFTANGTYTPSTGIINAIIECIGGGGGGGSASGTAGQYYGGGGGGSGGYSRVYVTAATIGASQSVTVGGGGNGGASGSNNGVTGSNTSVGTLCVSNGGVGGMFGSAAQAGAGGAGGAAGTGDVAGTGNVGTAGLYAAIGTVSFPSGNGAHSAFGGGAAGLATASGTCAAGNNAGNYGGGGSGAVCNQVGATNAAGGNGSTGIVVVTEFTNQ